MLCSRSAAEVIERHDLCHHQCDLGAEVAFEGGQCVRGVLDCVVQDGRAQGRVVDNVGILKPGQDPGDRYRMSDIRITAVAFPAVVAPGSDGAGSFDQFRVSTRSCGLDDLARLRDQTTSGCTRTTSGPFTLILPASSTQPARHAHNPWQHAVGSNCTV